MNITLLTSPLEGGEAARVISYLADFWAEAGHAVALLSSEDGSQLSFHTLDGRVDAQCRLLPQQARGLCAGGGPGEPAGAPALRVRPAGVARAATGLGGASKPLLLCQDTAVYSEADADGANMRRGSGSAWAAWTRIRPRCSSRFCGVTKTPKSFGTVPA